MQVSLLLCMAWCLTSADAGGEACAADLDTARLPPASTLLLYLPGRGHSVTIRRAGSCMHAATQIKMTPDEACRSREPPAQPAAADPWVVLRTARHT